MYNRSMFLAELDSRSRCDKHFRYLSTFGEFFSVDERRLGEAGFFP